MKTRIRLLLYLVLIIQFAGCNKDENRITNDGFNLYLSKSILFYNPATNYAAIDMDTIALCDEPFISYNNIAYYDTSKNYAVILGLRSNKSDIEFAGNMRLFVAKLDDRPVYIGFLWSIFISQGSNWIFIEDPKEENGLKSNELRILTNPICDNQVLNPKLIERLRIDDKLK